MKKNKRKKAKHPAMVLEARLTGHIDMVEGCGKEDLPLEVLLTEGSVAHYLNISVSSVQPLIRREQLPVVKIGKQVRVHPLDVREFMTNKRRPRI